MPATSSALFGGYVPHRSLRCDPVAQAVDAVKCIGGGAAHAMSALHRSAAQFILRTTLNRALPLIIRS